MGVHWHVEGKLLTYATPMRQYQLDLSLTKETNLKTWHLVRMIGQCYTHKWHYSISRFLISNLTRTPSTTYIWVHEIPIVRGPRRCNPTNRSVLRNDLVLPPQRTVQHEGDLSGRKKRAIQKLILRGVQVPAPWQDKDE